MTIVSIEEAQANLKELIHRMTPGDEVVITENDQVIAKLVSEPASKPGLRLSPGLGKGMITIVSEDDDHLKGFDKYAISDQSQKPFRPTACCPSAVRKYPHRQRRSET